MTRSQRVQGKTWSEAPQASARQESAIRWDEQHKVREEVAGLVRQVQSVPVNKGKQTVVAEVPVQQISMQSEGLHVDANPVGECSSSTKMAQAAKCSKKTVKEADCSKRTVQEAERKPAQEAERREDGRAAEQAPLDPSTAGRPKVSIAE